MIPEVSIINEIVKKLHILLGWEAKRSHKVDYGYIESTLTDIKYDLEDVMLRYMQREIHK